MKTFLAGLQNSVQTSYSNNGVSTMLGRAYQKSINSQNVIGPALTQFIDVETTVGFVPQYSYYNPNTGHLFICSAIAPATTIALYTFNNSTGVYAYVGKINLNLPNAAATTYVSKGFAVYENAGIIYPIISASASVIANGGTLVAWGLTAASFTASGMQIYAASGSGQQALYLLQDPMADGVNNVATTTWGLALPQFSSNSAVNTKVWQWNGTLAAAQLYSWDLSVTPTVANIVSTISAQTSTYANTYSTASAYFTMGVTSNNGYNLSNGDQVVLMGTIPTGFTAWSAGTLQVAASNVYFVRDLQQQFTFTVPALPNQYTFTTSATSAAIYPGVQFTNNGVTFTVPTAYASGVFSVVGQGASAPTSSGTLTLVAGAYVFTVAATTLGISPGATYTNNGQTFTANVGLATGVVQFALAGTGAPLSSGTLTLATGSGPATLAFTAGTLIATPATVTFSAVAAVAGITAAATYTYSNNGTSYTFSVPTAVVVGSTSIVGAVLAGNPAPPVIGSAGVLSLASGAGPATIPFTASVAGNWYFNLGATSGGVAVAPTTNVSNFTMMRAFGIATNQFSLKTAPMGTAFALGTILTSQSVGYCNPISSPANTALQGSDCLYMGTTLGLYMGKISDLSTLSYNFTIASSTVTVGAVYMQNGQYFTVQASISAATTLNCKATGAPSGAGVLTLVSGTGPTTLAFSLSAIAGNTWASMTFAGVNITGTGLDIVVPGASLTTYSGQGITGDTDRFIYVTNTSTYVMKPYQNGNFLTAVFGGVTDTYYETLNPISVQMGATALTGINCIGGWFFACSSGVGQRGIVFADVGSDATFGYSAVISPVLSVQPGTTLRFIDDIEQLFAYTDSVNFWIRSASSSASATFSSANLPSGSPIASGTVSNGWTNIQTASDLQLSSIAIGPYYQICATYQILTLLANTPAQIYDIMITCQPPGESSDNWAYSGDNSTTGLGSPSYAAWYQQSLYASAVPTLYARVYDGSGNLIFSANTVSNPTAFQYSSNAGVSWTALGTIPNAVGTLVRVLVTPTPSVAGFVSIRES